jgi:hypothetical protein
VSASVFDFLKDAVPTTILRVVLVSGPASKVKVLEAYADGVKFIDEDGAEFSVPFAAIAAVRDVTTDPAFAWKGK